MADSFMKDDGDWNVVELDFGLEPGTMADDYYVYKVLRPLRVKAGEVRPWFSESGGGMQYRLDAIDGARRSPSTLTAGDNPYLREVFKEKYGSYE